MGHKARQPGLDGRHRDNDGSTRRKNGNTLVRTLGETYGDDFAAGTRADTKLSTVLKRAGVETLDQYLKQGR